MPLTIQIKVIPSAKKRHWKLEATQLKLYLTSPAREGKANKALIQIIADALRLPVRAITIVSGNMTRIKRIAIETPLTYEQFLHAIGCASDIRTQTSFIR